MKIFFILLLMISCTRKYQGFPIIDKNHFDKDNYDSPITSKMYPGKKVQASTCSGQIFFSSNAYEDTKRQLQNIVRTLCPDSQYLIENELTETWWTTIIYSRSCVELISFCPRNEKKEFPRAPLK